MPDMDQAGAGLAALLAGPVEVAARGLLGGVVTAGGVSLRLTEVEAYAGVGLDEASHAHRGPTPRNTPMFGPPGVAYVYFVFGMHWCLNVVCGPPGQASAVLLRAGAVVAGLDLARGRRPGVPDRELARGPGRLTKALGIDGLANATPLLGGGPITLAAPHADAVTPSPGTVMAGTIMAGTVMAGPRVGVAGAKDVPWRFWVEGEPSVTPYRRHAPRRR